MGAYFTYIKLEIKRAMKTLPRFLTGAIVLVFLLGTIAFSASKVIYGEAVISRIVVGVVLPKDDQLAKTAISMLATMDSVKSVCDFKYMDEEDGRDRLKAEKIHALMIVPDGFLTDIITGVNTPVRIIFPDDSGIESMVFKELADSGTRTLGVAQASIYAADEICYLYQMPESIAAVEDSLNQIYFKYALPRDDYFRHYQVTATEDITTIQYYGISAVILCLLFCGISIAPICTPQKQVLQQKLKMIGIGKWKQILAKIISVAILLGMVMGAVCGLLSITKLITFQMIFIPVIILVCFTISSIIIAIYQITASNLVGVMCLFWITIGMLFLSGGLVPIIFLPETIRSFAKVVPTTDLISVFKGFLGNGFSGISIIKTCMWGIIFYLLAVLSGRRRV